MAQVCCVPAETATTAFVKPGTTVGVVTSGTVPLPAAAVQSPSPQHSSWPSSRIAQVW